MDGSPEDKEVLEPEVLPPVGKAGRASTGRPPWRRAERAFGPILAGGFLDLIDLATMGFPGFLIGAAAGYYLARIYELPARQRIILSLAAGWYCMMPLTRFLPVATLVGAFIRFRESARPDLR